MKKSNTIIACFLSLLLGIMIGGFVESIYESDIPEEEVDLEMTTKWRSSNELNIENLFEELIAQEIDYPEIVLAQALLETGDFKSYSCRERHNLFGLRNRTGAYMVFPHWTYSVAAYKKYIQKYKETPEDYYNYLNKIGYAEDSLYTIKVKNIHKNYVENRNP